MDREAILKSLIPAGRHAEFIEWAREGGYDESWFDRFDSKSRALEEAFLEEAEAALHPAQPAASLKS